MFKAHNVVCNKDLARVSSWRDIYILANIASQKNGNLYFDAVSFKAENFASNS